MSTTVVLLTRDLRVHDHPALHAAVERSAYVVPVFVLDEALLRRSGAPNRVVFLLDALADLRGALASRGSGLVVAETPSRRLFAPPSGPGRSRFTSART